MEDVIDILFHRKVTAAQTFVLKLFVSFENQILFKQKKHRQLINLFEFVLVYH